MDKQAIVEKEKKYVLGTYPRLPFVLERGNGMILIDTEGNSYLDFGSGIAVMALGHSDAEISAVVQAQTEKLNHVSNLYHTGPHAELAEALCESSFANKVFFSNSGAEAVETALKLARKYARAKYGEGKTKVVAFEGGFHGRTVGALSVTAREQYQAPFRPLVPNIEFAPFNDVAAARTAIDAHTCAVIVEPVQGEGGVHSATPLFIQVLREACDAHDVLLIVDEIQSGMGRTGKLWGYQHYDLKPNLLTSAKALGGGFPIGATLMTDAVAEVIAPGDHGSTFGGGPVVSSVAKLVLQRVGSAEMLAHVEEMGDYLKERLTALKSEHIQQVRQLGLMVGIELDIEAKPFYAKAAEHGILLLTAGPNVLRLLPPLIVTKQEIDQLVSVLELILE